MDCNPRVQLIDICIPLLEWAIPESSLTQVLLSGTKMNEPQGGSLFEFQIPPPPPEPPKAFAPGRGLEVEQAAPIE